MNTHFSSTVVVRCVLQALSPTDSKAFHVRLLRNELLAAFYVPINGDWLKHLKPHLQRGPRRMPFFSHPCRWACVVSQLLLHFLRFLRNAGKGKNCLVNCRTLIDFSAEIRKERNNNYDGQDKRIMSGTPLFLRIIQMPQSHQLLHRLKKQQSRSVPITSSLQAKQNGKSHSRVAHP